MEFICFKWCRLGVMEFRFLIKMYRVGVMEFRFVVKMCRYGVMEFRVLDKMLLIRGHGIHLFQVVSTWGYGIQIVD
jgi:hypothetical protein